MAFPKKQVITITSPFWNEFQSIAVPLVVLHRIQLCFIVPCYFNRMVMQSRSLEVFQKNTSAKRMNCGNPTHMNKNLLDLFAFILQCINQFESWIAVKTSNKVQMNIITVLMNLNSKIWSHDFPSPLPRKQINASMINESKISPSVATAGLQRICHFLQEGGWIAKTHWKQCLFLLR